MRVVILGCGRVGSNLAKLMAQEGHEVTVIDQTSESFRVAEQRLGTRFKATRVLGPGTDLDVLRRAGIETADIFVSVTQGDNTNIMAAQIAKEAFKVPKVLTRIYDPIRAQAYQEMGVHTICTTTIAAGLMRDIALERPVGKVPGEDLLQPAGADRQQGGD